MIENVLFLAFMAFLFKFSTIDRWWLWFVILIGLAVECGLRFSTIELIVAITVWKVLKDLFRDGKRN
jgi:hypothetical protein